jgi:protein-tyrosine-phosphatase
MRGLPDSVLFACSHNAVRSPMAENMLKHLAGSAIYIDSAGVRAGELDPLAVEVMGEVGVDLSRHQPKTFASLENSYFDLIVSLSPEAQHRAVEMTRAMACEVEFWRTLDPTDVAGSRAMQLDIYRQVRDSLFTRIRDRFDLTLKG